MRKMLLKFLKVKLNVLSVRNSFCFNKYLFLYKKVHPIAVLLYLIIILKLREMNLRVTLRLYTKSFILFDLLKNKLRIEKTIIINPCLCQYNVEFKRNA